jgi:hypothetical protein
LFVDNMLYKCSFNESLNAIFLECFDGFCKDDNYLLSIIFLYFKSFHCFGYGVGSSMKENPFGNIRSINHNDPKKYIILFEKCISKCDASN